MGPAQEHITTEQYKEFYKAISHDFEARPLAQLITWHSQRRARNDE